MNLIKKQLRIGRKKIASFLRFDFKKKPTPAPNYTGASSILEFDYGHLLSKQKHQSIDANQHPLPWFTYPAIEYFKQLDLSQKTMLEWGAGNSSLFFAERVKHLYSIEHNKEWFEEVNHHKIPNQTLVWADRDYANKPSEIISKVDIVLIDGIEREACAFATIPILNKGGMIILDNSDRHPDLAAYFREQGFIEVDFHGLGPINDYTWTTSIFLDRQIDIKPITIQPTIPIGGGY